MDDKNKCKFCDKEMLFIDNYLYSERKKYTDPGVIPEWIEKTGTIFLCKNKKCEKYLNFCHFKNNLYIENLPI